MRDISKKTLDIIKKEKIQPYARKRYLIKKIFIWALVTLSMVLGIVASGVVLFQLTHTDWDLYHRSSYSLIEFIMLAIPYFWFLFFIVFWGVAYKFFRRTEKGYRYRPIFIICSCVLLSIVGGLVLYQIGFAENLEAAFYENIPVYRTLNKRKHSMWVSPERGFLAGRITEIVSSEKIVLIDLQGKEWPIDISNVIWRGRLSPKKDLEIKIIGKMDDKGGFTALEIRPMRGRRMRGKGQHRTQHRH
ncbi:hypothetical protein JW935_00030 [candidate division KSB1 bacterium]|nr:hypothetical protein [candidate division KSB1 bacterium]